MVIKRVGVWSVARMYGAMSAAIGLFAGIIFALASMVGVSLSESNQSPFVGMMFGAGALIALPIFYGLMGLIGGAIGALIYNALAALVGGISVEVE